MYKIRSHITQQKTNEQTCLFFYEKKQQKLCTCFQGPQNFKWQY